MISIPRVLPVYRTLGVRLDFGAALGPALFGRVIEASETLGIDASFRAKVAAAREKLLPLRSRSMATSALPPPSPRCSSRAMPVKSSFFPRFLKPGATER